MSVEFEPARLGPRRRRFDPVAFGVVAVAFALLLAVVKPWAGPDQAAPAEEAAASAVEAAASAAGSPAPVAIPRIVRPRAPNVTDWAQIRNAVRRHESWGIRAILSAPGSDGPVRRLVERWYRLPAGGTRPAVAAVDVRGVEIVALGITFPPSQMPLDVRIWRLGAGVPEWIDIAAVDTASSGGAFVYVRPLAPGRPMLTGREQRSWEPGTYRVDVLVDGRIRTVGFRIFDPAASAVADATPTPTPSPLPIVAATESTLPDLTIGAFLTADGAGIPLDGLDGPPLDTAGAWLNIDPGTRRTPRSLVAVEYRPTATGLGAMLPPGSIVRDASLERLAPVPFDDPVGPGVRPPDAEAPEHVLFLPPGGGVWAPGVYRISVEWADPDGIHDRSWHVELRPGPVREQPRLLAAARAWARYAGETGVVLGTVEPLEGGPRSVVIRLIPLRPEVAYPAGSGVGCGGTLIAGRPQVIGFAHDVERVVEGVEATIRRPFRRRGPVVLNVARGIPGLVLVAPARSRDIGDANYEFLVGTGDTATTYFLCHGMSTFDDSPPP